MSNSAFSNVVTGIGISLCYSFHVIVGTFLAGPCGDVFLLGKLSSLHLKVDASSSSH